ncbi:MAG: hypothetical protein QM784_20170 [Polyangiaceae bacterium]
MQPAQAPNRDGESVRIAQLEAEVGRLNATVAQLSERLAAGADAGGSQRPTLTASAATASSQPEISATTAVSRPPEVAANDDARSDVSANEDARSDVSASDDARPDAALPEPAGNTVSVSSKSSKASRSGSAAAALCNARDKALIEDELYRAQRALVRVIEHLELTADAKRALLRGLRPARALDTANPWVAATD